MAAARGRALDVTEQQVLIDFYANEGVQWHARLLLVRLDRPGSWIVARPDHVVETIDLTIYRVIPMTRGTRVPAH
eukprot:14231538-Heterocapsa_arctica.AAC.1